MFKAAVLFFCVLLVNISECIDKSILRATSSIENGERRIVVIIGSYNNSQWYKKNLDSIFNQKYQNYRVIYTDDCSSDGNAHLVQEYIKKKNQEHRVLLIKNAERRYKMANIYRSYHLCNDSDVIIELDGDDWLTHDHVFTRYNEIYQDPNVWMTYGHYSKWPTGEPQYMNEIPAEIIENNSFRTFQGRCWEGLRTYYAWLVKSIKVEDFLLNGLFMERTSDVAIMFPMFEMAHTRFKLLTEMMMQHNNASNLNDYKVDGRLQYDTYVNIMKRLAYKPLETSLEDAVQINKNQDVDIVIHSDNNIDCATQMLNDECAKISGVHHITIVYNASDYSMENAYQELEQEHPEVTFIRKNGGDGCKLSMLEALDHVQTPYVIFAYDESHIIDPLDIPYCVMRLEQTKADAFFFALDQTSPEVKIHNFIEDDVYLSQFYYLPQELKEINKPTMALYRTDILRKMTNQVNFTRKQEAERRVAHKKIAGNKTALFFKQAKVIQN